MNNWKCQPDISRHQNINKYIAKRIYIYIRKGKWHILTIRSVFPYMYSTCAWFYSTCIRHSLSFIRDHVLLVTVFIETNNTQEI